MSDSDIKKQEAYRELVEARRICRACPGLRNSSEIHDGGLDSTRIGPYSRWQGNLDAPVLVVAQDFSDEPGFIQCQGWPGETVQTNLTLVKLFKAAGVQILPPKIGRSDDRAFFTNAVLCMKSGGRQAAIPKGSYEVCGNRFLRPTIELVNPKAVVSLGVGALRAVLTAFELPMVARFLPVVEAGATFELPSGPRLFPFCHPSPTVVNTTRSLAEQESDWRRLGAWLGAA